VNDRLRAALGRRIDSHNKLVKLSTLWSALLVIAMWLVIYFFVQWVLLFLASAARGTEGDLPAHFRRFFFIGVAVWFGVYWFMRWREGATLADDKGVRGTFADFILLPPRATIGAARNLDNLVRLSSDEIDAAAAFLERLVRAGKLPASSLPVELPGEDEPRDRVLAALQLMDLIYIRRPKHGDELVVPSNPQRLLAFL
jgi:hypothetical protein